MLHSSSGLKFAGSDQTTLAKEDLNLRLSMGVGMLIDSNRHGLNLAGVDFNLCVCQIVPGGILHLLEMRSYSY